MSHLKFQVGRPIFQMEYSKAAVREFARKESYCRVPVSTDGVRASALRVAK